MNLPCLLFFTSVFEGNQFPKYKAKGGLYLEGRIHTCFGGLFLEGLIHGGAYFRNFTVSQRREVSVKQTFS